jgi:PCFT/HCP family folate transporter-like MFS transporter 1/3
MEATLLFAERAPLSWKKSMYGYLLATDYAGLGMSTLFILPFLIRWLHLVDMSMVLIGVVFRIIRLIILAASSSTFGIYISVIVGAPSSLIVSCSKALISKTIHVSVHSRYETQERYLFIEITLDIVFRQRLFYGEVCELN